MSEHPLYADSSAITKLIVQEAESDALQTAVEGRLLVTSELALVEVRRAVQLSDPELLPRADRFLRECALIPISRSQVEAAALIVTQQIRALDAIHLAAALGVDVAEMAVYDHRLAAAALEHGLKVLAPS